MYLFQFHLFRVGVPFMILVSFCKDYVDICYYYNAWIGVFIGYYYIRSYWDRRRYVLVNVSIAAILVMVLLSGVEFLEAIENDGKAVVNILLLLNLAWQSFFLYFIQKELEIDRDTFLDMDFFHKCSISKRVGTLRVVLAILLLQIIMIATCLILYYFLESVLFAYLTIVVVLLSDAYMIVEIHSDVHLSSHFAKAFSNVTSKALPFFLTRVCIYVIMIHKKHVDYVDEYRKMHDITDIVFMCMDYKRIISFAWNECLFSLRYEAKKYRSILTHYYDSGRFLMYCLIVSFSAVVFTWLCLFAFDLFVIQFDGRTHITFLEENTPRTRYTNLEKGILYERHINEDVTFNCDLYVPPDWKNARIMWIHNGSILHLKGSERIQFSKKRSEMSILLIDHMDYGEYQCAAEYQIFVYTPHIVRGVIFYRHIERKIHNSSTIHRLKTLVSSKEYYHVDFGGLVWKTFLVYFSLAKEEDVSFIYTVNGEDVHDICTPDITSCSWTSYIMKYNYRSTFQNRLEVNRISAGMYSVHSIDLKTCMCSSMYGMHEIVIYRNFFNKTTLKNTVVEIIYPVKYQFYPKNNETFIYNKLCESSVPIEVIRSILKVYDELVIPPFLWFPERKVNALFLINRILSFVRYCLYALCVWFFKSVINFYCRVTIAPFRNRILFGSFTIPRPSMINNTPLAGIEGNVDIQYDVYLSSSEEDDITAMSVVTFLETDCHLRVCVPARDLVHEGNISYFTSFSRATEQCRKFIVILSNHYTEDDMCNNVQLMSCIIPLIHSTRRQGRDLIFLKLDKDVEIPVQIMFDPDVKIINYTTDDDDIEARRKLRRLLFTN